MPFGYKAAPFVRFVESFNSEMRAAGYDDAEGFMQGSAASGEKYNNGNPIPLDARAGITPTDYDVAIVSPKIMARAKELGMDITNGPLTPAQTNALGLTNAQEYLTTASKGSKPVNFKVYPTKADVYKYGKTIPFNGSGG